MEIVNIFNSNGFKHFLLKEYVVDEYWFYEFYFDVIYNDVVLMKTNYPLTIGEFKEAIILIKNYLGVEPIK